MVERALDVVDRLFSSERQAPDFAAALEATVLHSRLPRASSGRPRIAYFCHSPHLGGAENHLLRHAALAGEYRFEPVLVLPAGLACGDEELPRRATDLGIAITSLPLVVETEIAPDRLLDEALIAAIERWLREHRVALVHTATLMREVGEATRRIGLPHVASLYQTNSRQPAGVDHCDIVHSDSLLYANIWSEVLGVPGGRILSHVPTPYFNLGDAPRPRQAGGSGERSLAIGLFGSIQARKGQLQAIEAVGLLKREQGVAVQLRLFGYDHFYPEYLALCQQMVEHFDIGDLVSFEGFVREPVVPLREIDAVLCASDWESLPQVILEAMAAGRLVIAPNVGGVGEVISERTGILMPSNNVACIREAVERLLRLTPDQWNARVSLAREVAEHECAAGAVASQLFRLYGKAAAARAGMGAAAVTDGIASKSSSEFRSGLDLPAETLAGTLEKWRTRLREINAGL
jgi:glycosyltransferase involved in cell wall biosynthesis